MNLGLKALLLCLKRTGLQSKEAENAHKLADILSQVCT